MTHGESETDASGTITSAIIVEGAVGVVAVLLGLWWNQPPLADAKLDVAGIGAGLFATIPTVVFFLYANRTQWEPLARIRLLLEKQVIPMFARCSLWQLAGVAAIAGLAEEMLFRGVIQAALQDLIGAPLALAAASVVFGLMHALTPAYAVTAMLMGVYLGGLWLATGNLVAPIITHALYDFIAISLMVRAYRKGHGPAPPTQTS